jgi:asparagine synthase (glutamine-hydrolysing)
LTPAAPERQRFEAVLRGMTDSIAHRGPDDHDCWLDPAADVGLGHRRLSILDLSPLGRQPMRSASGRYVICFNGEVYNFARLRAELEPLGHAFRGGSDTEVMLAAIEQWGLAAAVSRFIGMFAFALWDAKERTLHLVRDRLGIKPLYYGAAGRDFVFGSELKALRAHPGFDATIDREALALYFRHNYIPAPRSICRDARKLPAGCILSIRPGGEPAITSYWSAEAAYRAGGQNPWTGSEDEALDRLEALLGDAVDLRMIADVPLGAFLSGGIDSSLVVALMQARSPRPVQTFSIGFAERRFNEAPHAAAVARHLGTEHTELMVSERELLDIVPLVPRFWDEPFADSSQIPTYAVNHLARNHVTVALSGDGGDELFYGYDRYFFTQRVWAALSRLPFPLRKAMAMCGKALPQGLVDRLGGSAHRLRWRLDALGLRSFDELYGYFLSHFKDPAAIVLGTANPPDNTPAPLADRFAWMSLCDVMGYLPDDILVKVDRASMAVALEARVPLLDHRVVEFAATLPTAMKVQSGQGKHLLRRLLYRHVPRELVDRPKMGFGVPIDEWMRGKLRPWCEDLLDTGAIRRQGLLDARLVERIWREYLAGRGNWSYHLWDVLMFQAWLGHWGGA